MKRNAGFTLMELMVTIAVIGVLGAVAAPGMSAWFGEQRLSQCAGDVQSLLRKAKIAAINGRTPVLVSFTTGAGSAGTCRAFVDNDGGTANVFDSGDTLVVPQVSMPDGVALRSAAFNGGVARTTRFNSMGLPVGFDGTVVLGDSDLEMAFRRVAVSGAGNIKVQKSHDGASWCD